MTPQEYTTWLKTRGEPGTWKMADCIAADNLVRDTALETANKWIDANIPEVARPIFSKMLSVHFGSIEVDAFLKTINAYPDWMERE